MEAVKEVTVWAVEYRQPNHTYLMDGDKAVAYISWHEGEPEFFKVPQKMDKRYRKFEKADIGLFDVPEQKKDPAILAVPGSKGATYLVNTEDRTCTCPGFTFRSTCKHTKELELEEH
jgi:hypothetical protein